MYSFFNRYKISITIFFLIVIVSIYFFKYSKILIPERQRKDINQKIIIPPEVFSGDTIYIGDDFKRIAHFIKMSPFWYTDGLSKEIKYWPGYYYASNRNIGHLQFNYNQQLIKIDISISSKDSLSPKDFFSQIVKVMVKYYGSDYKIYSHIGNKPIKILFWNLPDNNTLYIEGKVSNSIDTNSKNFISIYYNDSFNDDFYKLNTTKTDKDLGLEL